MYRSSPPLPCIFRPFHLLLSTHAPPKPDPEESLSIESYIDSFDSEFGHAEAGEDTGEDETRVAHPKGARTTAWKRRA